MAEGKITLYIATSVDGYIATEDGGVSWLEEYQDETETDDGDGGYEEFFDSVDCLVMGSTTYEQVLGFGEWPYEQKPTFVITRRDLPLANSAVELFDGNLDSLARELIQQHEYIWLVGGAQLAQAFLRIEHVNTLHLSLIPVLLGSGIPLFVNIDGPHGLKLIESTALSSGIVELQYSVKMNQ